MTPHRVGAQQQGLVAARVQQAVGEDVAALRVAAELNSSMARNETSGRVGIASTVADLVARVRRHDLLFAGDQRQRPRPPRTTAS